MEVSTAAQVSEMEKKKEEERRKDKDRDKKEEGGGKKGNKKKGNRVHHRVEYISEGHTVSHRWTRVAAGVAEAIDHTRTVLHATRSFKAIRDSVRITASIRLCALGVLSISSGKGRTGRERGRTSVRISWKT